MKNKMYKKRGHPPNGKIILIMIGVGLVLVAIAIGVVFWLKGNPPETNEPPLNGDGVPAATNVIETPYCNLRYPSEYLDHLEVKEISENGVYGVQFLCTLSIGQQKLFAVHFGQGAPGDFFGYLIRESEKTSIYIECYELISSETLSEEENRMYYYMMDAVNEVVRSISEAEGFSAY